MAFTTHAVSGTYSVIRNSFIKQYENPKLATGEDLQN